MLYHEQIKVTTAGSAGSAAGTAYSKEVVCGRIEAAYISYAAGGVNTCDVTAGMRSTPTESFLNLANGTTAKWVYPRRAVHDNAAATINYATSFPIYDKYVCYEHVSVVVAETNALTDAVIVDLYWSEE